MIVNLQCLSKNKCSYFFISYKHVYRPVVHLKGCITGRFFSGNNTTEEKELITLKGLANKVTPENNLYKL